MIPWQIGKYVVHWRRRRRRREGLGVFHHHIHILPEENSHNPLQHQTKYTPFFPVSLLSSSLSFSVVGGGGGNNKQLKRQTGGGLLFKEYICPACFLPIGGYRACIGVWAVTATSTLQVKQVKGKPLGDGGT